MHEILLKVCKGASILYFNILFLSFLLLSEDILIPRLESTKWFNINLKDTPFNFSINSLRLYISPECLLNFLPNFYIFPWLGKMFNFMVSTFLENALNLGTSTHAFPSHLKLFPKLLSSHNRQAEVTHSPRQHFFENLFLPTAEFNWKI